MSGRKTRLLAWSALTTLALSMIAAVPAYASAAGPYDGYAHGSVVHVDALTASGTRLADAEVGVSNASVDSEGLSKVLNAYDRPIVPAGLSNKNSRAAVSIAEAGLAHAPDAPNQIAPFTAESVSPGGDDVDSSVLKQNVSPVAYVDVLHTIATSRWNADTCIIGEPIASAEEHLARVQVLEQAADDSTEGFDGALVGVDADKVGPKRASTSVRSVQQLFKGAGSGLGLQSATTATIAPVTLLAGTANEFTIEVSGPAFLSVTADGAKGGAKVAFRVPLVTIIQNGVITQALPGNPIEIVQPGTGDAIASIKVGVLEDQKTSASGTSASAVANVVEVKLLDLVSQNLRGATVAIGHLEAATNVPAGGIDCPIPVSKSANPISVTSGDQFTVTITVDNPFTCPLEAVELTDVISTQDAALFEIIDTDPKADSATSGSDLSAGRIHWSLGSIAPGKSKSVKVTFLAQGQAGKIIDVATASGSLSNCAAGPADAEADVTALAKVKVPVDGNVKLTVPESKVLGETILPSTGVGGNAVGIVLLGLSGAVAILGRRRRVGAGS